MKEALRASLSGDTSAFAKSTANALMRRGLWDCERRLTDSGWLLAVESAPLEVQARELGLPIQELKKSRGAPKPEIAAYECFSSKGYVGSWCEGGPILLLIRAAALDYLHAVNPLGSRADACRRFTEAQLTMHSDKLDELCSTIAAARLADVMENFREIYADLEVQETYPGLDNKKMLAIAEALTMPKLSAITEVLGLDPYRLRSGWPDLTLASGDGSMLWAEVKTTDKLLPSQIRTISTVRHLLPGQIMLVHVS